MPFAGGSDMTTAHVINAGRNINSTNELTGNIVAHMLSTSHCIGEHCPQYCYKRFGYTLLTT